MKLYAAPFQKDLTEIFNIRHHHRHLPAAAADPIEMFKSVSFTLFFFFSLSVICMYDTE